MNDLLQKRFIEYEKAQDSAEHYNTMCWTLTSLLLAFSISIVSILFNSLNNPNPTIYFKIILFGGGLFSLIYFNFLIEKANAIKEIKYHLCKKIESRHLFLGQNLLTEELDSFFKKRGIYFIRRAVFVLLIVYLGLLACEMLAYFHNLLIIIILSLFIIADFCGLIIAIFLRPDKKVKKIKKDIDKLI